MLYFNFDFFALERILLDRSFANETYERIIKFCSGQSGYILTECPEQDQFIYSKKTAG